MAKKFRSEKEILTVDIQIDIPSNLVPPGVDIKKLNTIKISAYPAAWDWLSADLNTLKTELERIIRGAIATTEKLFPSGRRFQKKYYKRGHINEEFFNEEDNVYCYKQERQVSGLYYRGSKKNLGGTINDVKYSALWLHVLFRYCKIHGKDFHDGIRIIYDKIGNHRRDPNILSYKCCKILYERDYISAGQPFPSEASFRTGYLATAGKFRPLTDCSPAIVAELIEKKEHPLKIVKQIAGICKNTNTKM